MTFAPICTYFDPTFAFSESFLFLLLFHLGAKGQKSRNKIGEIEKMLKRSEGKIANI